MGPQPILLQLLEIGCMTLFLTGLEEEIMWSGPLVHQTFLPLTSFSRAGVPKLSPSVYPFSISIDERVPLNMGA